MMFSSPILEMGIKIPRNHAITPFFDHSCQSESISFSASGSILGTTSCGALFCFFVGLSIPLALLFFPALGVFGVDGALFAGLGFGGVEGALAGPSGLDRAPEDSAFSMACFRRVKRM